ncbi:MAG: hypothetical protein ETSY1_31595 [Candidatus Entotheonella factor]|uniref:O-antigen ligase-related domain-containing protein n=1 Tax=Entotheonella factor TaxID=1429438 RepID=W4LBA0_ENTF1|nr:MAG: hypothetical protein ETSY1_31595 [Candidatus Entotheonella factor]
MLFRFLILLSLFFFILSRKQLIKLRLNIFEISFLAYISVITLSAYTGIALDLSIFSNIERFNGVEGQIYLFFYIYLTSRLLDKRQWWRIIFGSLILISIWINIDALVKHGTDIATGYGSLFGSKNYLAGFNFSVFVISIFLYLTPRESIYSKAFLVIGVLALLVALITFTRAPLLGFSLAVGFWFVSFGAQSFQHHKWFIPALIIMSLIGIGFILKFSDNLLHTQNMQTRLDMWQISLQGFQEAPLLGVGPENFGYLFDKYHPGQYVSQDEQWIDNAHNMLFNILSETGLIGLLSFSVSVFILFQCAYRQCQKHDADQPLFVTLIMLYIEQLFTLNPISQNIPQCLIIAYFTKSLPAIQLLYIKSKLLINLTRGITCFVIVATLYTTIVLETYKHYRFSSIYTDNPKYLSKTYDALLQYFNDPPMRDTYLTQKIATDFIKMKLPNQVPKRSISLYKKLIIDQLRKSIATNPKNIRTQVILGWLYARFHPQQAVYVFLNVVKQAPRKPINHVYLAHAYLRVGKTERAKASLNRALTLDLGRPKQPIGLAHFLDLRVRAQNPAILGIPM